MSSSPKAGFDAAQVRREQDDLNRWRFASEIVDVISATPPEWSVRIGIFGKWGEGKTTVLRFAEQMLKDRQNIVFDFSPWAIQDWHNLWDSFGGSLVDALSKANIDVGASFKKTAKEIGSWLEKKGGKQIAETTALILGKDKLYN